MPALPPYCDLRVRAIAAVIGFVVPPQQLADDAPPDAPARMAFEATAEPAAAPLVIAATNFD